MRASFPSGGKLSPVPSFRVRSESLRVRPLDIDDVLQVAYHTTASSSVESKCSAGLLISTPTIGPRLRNGAVLDHGFELAIYGPCVPNDFATCRTVYKASRRIHAASDRFLYPASSDAVREVNAHLVVGSETSTGRRQSLDLTFRFYSTCTSKPRVASDPGEKKNPSQQ